MAELTDAVHDQITDLCERGDGFAGEGQFCEALTEYWRAWDLLPDPKVQWEAATWILTAIGDANFLSGDFVAGRDNLGSVMGCPGAFGNAFIHLRLGQCQFEVSNLDRAADELARAYLLEGAEIFDEEDPKYFAFLKTRLTKPNEGW